MMIQLKDVWRVYMVGDHAIEAVRGVSLAIASGEFVAIVGHSGSGKSTLLSLMGGLARPMRGAVLFDSANLWALSDDERSEIRNKKIGFVFQFASLIPTLDALDNVVLPYMFSSWERRKTDIYEEARELLVMVGLEDKLHAYPNELSGGQQRRVAIARALINHPAVILADEPTGDLDEETEADVIKLLLEARRRYGSALVLVTHNRNLAHTADRLLHMKNGSLIYEDLRNRSARN
ncbi:ABC transporter ATP-binding protein [Pelomicrobium methylotrophicum]|jgi:putative ABC transport system ATP-binding protein/lipoprotein-releasing system ATP-binding protein|uniref:ABC transporter ATP-binding protein n=1 Tax=Pelomicrobium methylotrophicum TaxID=2602750 RepID=A0A5C7EW42_9PROT|nr:ABC transporter ATP-binding protein [Pelomicrobium methylotrophicum]TXF11431.1 ABC transporter ATP-binding protein [Pelomicrobium methylotrophicum]